MPQFHLDHNDAPADRAPARAITEPDVFHATDNRGRRLELRKPPILATLKMIEFLGKAAENDTFMAYALPTMFVTAIDGDPVRAPRSRAEFDALVQRLDEEGLAAAATAIAQRNAERAAQEGSETAKKSP